MICKASKMSIYSLHFIFDLTHTAELCVYVF